MITKSVKQFLIYVTGGVSGTLKAMAEKRDRTSSNLRSGDLVSFTYRKTTGKDKGKRRTYTVVVVGEGDPTFNHPGTKNTLFGAYRVDHLSPETLTLILSSIYKRGEDLTYQTAERFLKSVIGTGDLGSKNYRTFNDKARGVVTKITVPGLDQIADDLAQENDELN